MNFSDAYCDHKKLMVMYQDGVNSQYYKKFIIDGNDVPAQRVLAGRVLNQMKIFDTENKIKWLQKSSFSNDFTESIRLLGLSNAFMIDFFKAIQDLQSFTQFKELMAGLSSSQDALQTIEFEMKRSYDYLTQSHAELLIPADPKNNNGIVNKSALEINTICDLSLSVKEGNWLDN